MGYLHKGDIVHWCEQYPSVKEHSRSQALGLLRQTRARLQETRELCLKYSDLRDEVQELDADLKRIDKLINWLEED